jgi:hypothetical protein
VLVGARVGARGLGAEWRVAPDVVAVLEEMSDAVSAAHRARVMGRRLPGWDDEGDGMWDDDPVCRLLRPRFAGF